MSVETIRNEITRTARANGFRINPGMSPDTVMVWRGRSHVVVNITGSSVVGTLYGPGKSPRWTDTLATVLEWLAAPERVSLVKVPIRSARRNGGNADARAHGAMIQAIRRADRIGVFASEYAENMDTLARTNDLVALAEFFRSGEITVRSFAEPLARYGQN